MKTAAIIAEFNPFHHGHRLVIEAARAAGADRVVVLMSGDYVQRGAPACMSRRARAEAALSCGTDVVLAYPSRFASSSAESFAEWAVRIFNALGTVDLLVFGSEEGDLERLRACAAGLTEEDSAFREKLRRGLREGLSYPAARAAALPEYADILEQPNNILAVEYLKALLRTGSSIEPVTILRKGSGYLDDETLAGTASAAAIRRAVSEQVPDEQWRETLPQRSYELMKKEISERGSVTEDDFSLLLADRLLTAGGPEDLVKYADVTEELAAAFFRRRTQCTSLTGFTELCKTRNITRTHVARALLHIALGIKRECVEQSEAGLFTQVLGFRREAADWIGLTQRQSSIPVIMNPPAARDTLPPPVRSAFLEELRLCNLYEAARARKTGTSFRDAVADELLKI